MLFAGLADVVDAADVRMRDLPRESNFLMEASQPVGAMRDVLGQELERHDLSEFQVFGSIHLAHAAPAHQADDPIAAGQHRARNELRAVERTR